MTKAHEKRGGLIAGLAQKRRFFASQRALVDVQADPHLARDIGLPHRPRAALPLKLMW